MSIRQQDTEELIRIAAQNKEFVRKQLDMTFSIPKSRSKSLPNKPVADVENDAAKLESLVSALLSSPNFRQYDRIDDIFTRLKHKSAFELVSFEALSCFVYKIKENFTAGNTICFARQYSKEAKGLVELLEPLKTYLNLITFDGIDQRLVIDEMIESIFKLVYSALDKVVVPLCLNPSKEALKILERKKVQECMSSLCSVLEYLIVLIKRSMFQEHSLVSLTEVLIKTLFAEGAELLHLTCCFTLSGIISAYKRLAITILNEILNNLSVLTDDPNATLGSKSKRINCKNYNVSENISIKFSTFLVVSVIQHYSNLEKPIRIDGSVDVNQLKIQFDETLGLANKFISEVCDRAFKVKAENQDYRIYLESLTKDLLKLMYRPEFPISYQMINLLVLKLFSGLKTFSAVVRHFIVEELSLIGSYLKETIHEIKQSPVVPQQIIKVPMTEHPSISSIASTCLCKEGWDGAKDMIQCEECWKWFHLDCIGLDLDKYKEENWFCDDCRLFECLQHVKLLTPTVKEDEIVSLPRELIRVTQKYQRVYQHLIINYLITQGGRMENSSRSVMLGSWIESRSDHDLISLWRTPKISNLPRLSEKGTIKLLRQYLIVFELGLTYLHIQGKIISLLNAVQPLTRAKALKSLTNLVQADPECLAEDMIESAVTERLHDTSIAVREATVELLGKFITYKSEFSDTYFTNIMERLKDKGPSVRKRVIKILKDIISADPEHERIIEIFSEVIKRILDDTEGIRDAVVILFEEFWFTSKPVDLFRTVVKVVNILKWKDPIVLLFKALVVKNVVYKDQLDYLAQTATEQLVASSNVKLSILYAKILEIISLSSPELLLDQISTLHQFLTPSQSAKEEAELLGSICTIIGRTAEYMNSLNSARIIRIENQLLQLVFTQGSAVLHQALHALCKVVRLCSRNQSILTNLVQKCYTLLKSASKAQIIEKNNQPSLFRAMLAVGLSIKFSDKAYLLSIKVEEDKAFDKSVFEVFEILCKNKDKSVRDRALDSISLTWVKFPAFLPACDYIIKQFWSEAQTSEAIKKMLEVFQEFLLSCKEAILENQEDDAGNVINVIHGYLEQIIESALNTKAEVRESAAEVLKLIIMQGSVNVGHMIPSLFIMLGDESQLVKEAGFYCIEKSFVKNPDLVTVNLKKSLQGSYDFQRKVLEKKQNLINTFYPRLYLLIKNKKQLRNKFLKVILDALESEDPEFTEFLCGLLACFTFTMVEELIPVLNFLSGKIQIHAARSLRTVKILTSTKDKLKDENLAQVLVMIQMIVMKNYLVAAYNVKGIEDNLEKNVQKAEDVPGFDDEFEEFRYLFTVKEIEGDELVKFKQKFKILLGTQNADEVGLRKRMKKNVEIEEEKEVIEV